MLKHLLLTITLLSSVLCSATHLVGGEIYYDYLGNDQYKVTLIVYRDCGPSNSNNTQFDQQAVIGVFNNGNLATTLSVPIGPITVIPLTASNPCLTAPPSACIEEAKYEAIVTLPPAAGGYDIVYQRCCRNPSTMNIQNPNSQGSTYMTHIPEGVNATNSSPRFLNYPPTVLCVDNFFQWDHSATDPDGDVLVYSLCTPYTGMSPTMPAGTPTAPPYQEVIWNPGFSVNNQITGAPTLSINPATGELSGQPIQQGIFTFGVRVQEFRNGGLLSESRRDFQFWVTSCNPLLLASIPAQTDSCSGFTINFTNNSQGSSFYHWDFGDGNTSTATNPSHTYNDTGTYTIMLVANPGWPCADTAYTSYTVQDPLYIEIDDRTGQCITGNSFNFTATGNQKPGTTYQWNFTPLASPTSSTASDPQGISFLDSGIHIISLEIEDNGCLAFDQDSITIYPEPKLGMALGPQTGCEPYTVTFIDTSFSWFPLNYSWSFGDGNTSTEESPTNIYLNDGVYDVTLTISSDSGCQTTLTQTFNGLVNVLPSPTSDFIIGPEETDVFMPFFNVTDFSFGDIQEVYYIDATGDTIDFNADGEYVINDTGYAAITQWVYNSLGCPDSSVEYVYIRPVTTLYAPNSFTPDGDGINDVWKPEVQDVYSYECRIFTRWGQVIFESNSPNEGWDGTFRGKQSKEDVYVYQIVYRSMDKMNRVVTGHITLIR